MFCIARQPVGESDDVQNTLNRQPSLAVYCPLELQSREVSIRQATNHVDFLHAGMPESCNLFVHDCDALINVDVAMGI